MTAALKTLESDLKAAADAFVSDLTVKLVQGRHPVRLEPSQIEWLRGRVAVALTVSAKHGQQYHRDSRRPPPLPAPKATTAATDGDPYPGDEATTKPDRLRNKR